MFFALELSFEVRSEGWGAIQGCEKRGQALLANTVMRLEIQAGGQARRTVLATVTCRNFSLFAIESH